MIRSFLALSVALPSALFAQIPNPGFEQWSNATGVNEPVGWTTFNPLGDVFDVVFAEQGTPGAVGSSFIRLTAREITPGSPMLSLAITGIGSPGDDGFPYTTTPATLDGRYRFTPQGEDEGHVIVAFYKWDPVNNNRIGLGGGFLSVNATATEWTTFSVPLDFYNPLQPDTATISLISGGGNPTQPGTVFDVDDLHFAGTFTGVAEVPDPVRLLAYPSPTSDLLRWHCGVQGTPVQWEVLTLDGRVMLAGNDAGARRPIPVTSLPSAPYLLRVLQAGVAPVTVRFMKE
ncbi:MAG TPA: T9SS type A sorting domain-containing protein [Flavobacteriales bacterium]